MRTMKCHDQPPQRVLRFLPAGKGRWRAPGVSWTSSASQTCTARRSGGAASSAHMVTDSQLAFPDNVLHRDSITVTALVGGSDECWDAIAQSEKVPATMTSGDAASRGGVSS